MGMLILGVILWSIVHMVPVAMPGFRCRLISRMGENPYKGVFALVILTSVALIVFGWRSIDHVTQLYDFYIFGIIPAFFMLLAGFILIVAANLHSNFKRTVRHPQLTGFSLWAVAHLLVNGDIRTTILFGGMLIWSITTIILLNKRDGAFVQPAKQLPHKGVMVFALACILFIAAVLGHGYFTGVDLTVKH
jgi:uncharacterized membrane protein